MSINGVVQAEYLYNAAGQQVVRRLTQETRTIHSVHDLNGQRIAEYEVDPVTGTSTLLREYVWMDMTPVAVIENGQVYFIRADHIGRPIFATDASGTKVWEATYLPFGGLHTSSGDTIALRFPGQWFQSESGLHQNWMRDYDPTTGRYIQADPLGLVAGVSLYGYANQSPFTYIDPNGEHPLLVAALAGAAIGALVDFGMQFYQYGGRLECINWGQVGMSAALGAIPGGLGHAGKFANPFMKAMGFGKPTWRGKSAFFENSHFIGNRAFKGSSGLGKWFNQSGLNSTYVPWRFHAATDPFARQFLPRNLKRFTPNFGNPFNMYRNGKPLDFGIPLRTPPWLWGGIGAGLWGQQSKCGCDI
ncbi:RHS repeat domain-containing protein [Pseudaestuariivita rosea]|uniref:RHS repeat domain-containing protein n=1 Tax=Pseudaestuariivita rosea TaxID=2763263 RepID=UPI001ABA817A|nr:RHS repeat-associated core domain-containing protein [Pseudaestuariivita rosea]